MKFYLNYKNRVLQSWVEEGVYYISDDYGNVLNGDTIDSVFEKYEKICSEVFNNKSSVKNILDLPVDVMLFVNNDYIKNQSLIDERYFPMFLAVEKMEKNKNDIEYFGSPNNYSLLMDLYPLPFFSVCYCYNKKDNSIIVHKLVSAITSILVKNPKATIGIPKNYGIEGFGDTEQAIIIKQSLYHLINRFKEASIWFI